MKRLHRLGSLIAFTACSLILAGSTIMAADGPPPAEGKGKHKAEKQEAQRTKRISAIEERLRHLEEQHVKQLSEYTAEKARLEANLQTLRSGETLERVGGQGGGKGHGGQGREARRAAMQEQLQQLDEKLAKLQQRRAKLVQQLETQPPAPPAATPAN